MSAVFYTISEYIMSYRKMKITIFIFQTKETLIFIISVFCSCSQSPSTEYYCNDEMCKQRQIICKFLFHKFLFMQMEEREEREM